MRGLLIRMIELACRPVDATVCEIANLTDEPDPDFPEAAHGFPTSA